METTFEGTAEQARAAARRLKNDLDAGLHDLQSAAADEMKNLIADVEDLLTRISDIKDTDIARVRGKVLRAVDTAKASLEQGAETVKRQAQRAATATDDYVHETPWAAVGIAALVGAVVGILASRRSS